jgi:hypothetical protein
MSYKVKNGGFLEIALSPRMQRKIWLFITTDGRCVPMTCAQDSFITCTAIKSPANTNGPVLRGLQHTN